MKRRKVLSLGLVILISVMAIGCTVSTNTGTGKREVRVDMSDEKSTFIQKSVGLYEAEDAHLLGNVKAASSPAKQEYSGTGYIEGFTEDSDACVFKITITEEGFYDLNFRGASMGGEKYNNVSLDGQYLASVCVEEEDFTDSCINRVYMTAGDHEVCISKQWGWILLDYLEVLTAEPLDSSIYEVTANLSNPNSSDITKRLYSYLCDIYGMKFLSGQYCDTGQYGKEFQIIKKNTNKTPAVLGLDFIEYTPSRVEKGSVGQATEYAIDFWKKGGIVTICWHWNAPTKYLTGQWYSGFYKDYTNIDLKKIMDGEDKEGYQLLIKDIDAIAKQLLILQNENVPVLWRPLHEASGGWFWWGAFGPEAYKKLYLLLYDRLTNEYGLNNLIWVWNGQDPDWYPGDEYVDIIGEDIYPGERVYTSHTSAFLNAAKNYSKEKKIVHLTENGCLFDPDLARRDGAMWGMWCTWQGEFMAKNSAIYALSEQYTEKSMLLKVYEDKDVITLEDLPDFSTYEIRSVR